MSGPHALRAWTVRECIGRAGHRHRVAAVVLGDFPVVAAVANPRCLISHHATQQFAVQRHLLQTFPVKLQLLIDVVLMSVRIERAIARAISLQHVDPRAGK